MGIGVRDRNGARADIELRVWQVFSIPKSPFLPKPYPEIPSRIPRDVESGSVFGIGMGLGRPSSLGSGRCSRFPNPRSLPTPFPISHPESREMLNRDPCSGPEWGSGGYRA